MLRTKDTDPACMHLAGMETLGITIYLDRNKTSQYMPSWFQSTNTMKNDVRAIRTRILEKIEIRHKIRSIYSHHSLDW